jgi:hypothetical protein
MHVFIMILSSCGVIIFSFYVLQAVFFSCAGLKIFLFLLICLKPTKLCSYKSSFGPSKVNWSYGVTFSYGIR